MSNSGPKQRHLKPLPVKSFKVAPGDVVGGLIYIMDKPIGVEEGMIGMSIDSPGYREFMSNIINELIANKGKPASESPYPELQEKFNNIAKFDSFAALAPAQKDIVIDLFMHHPNIQRYLDSLGDDEKQLVSAIANSHFKFDPSEPSHQVTKVPFRENWNKFFGNNMHEIAGKKYENIGTGGLFLKAYLKQCDVNEKDHFAEKIRKVIHDGDEGVNEVNDVFMVKQDGKLGAFHGTGPGFAKICKTSAGRAQQKNVSPPRVYFVLPALYGLSRIGITRLVYLVKNDPTSVNSDAITETMSTKLALLRGYNSQNIDTIKGEYEDGSPKIATIVKWKGGCRDLSGRLMGGEKNVESLLVAQTAKGQTIKMDQQGNLLFRKEIKKDDKVVGYEYYRADNPGQAITKENKQEYKKIEAEYNKASAVAEDRVDGLGESLITFIAFGDNDGVGSKGQNKAIVPGENGRFNFYGIDFGKSYNKPVNPIIHTLRDDFSFEHPKSRVQDLRFKNYSMLYDNPLREKMKGVYLLAALRGKLTASEKEAIAKEYELSGDKTFADKLRKHPEGGKNADIKLIIAEIQKYQAEKEKYEKENNPEKAAEFQIYIDRLREIKDNAIKTDARILEVFQDRVKLLPHEIDTLEALEKLSAKKASNIQQDNPNNSVIRNHLHVRPEDRIRWQFKDGQLTTDKIDNTTVALLQKRIGGMKELLKEKMNATSDPTQGMKIGEMIAKLDKVEFANGICKLPKMSKDELTQFNNIVSEENIAKLHGISLMSKDQRIAFTEKRDKLNSDVKKLEDEKKQQQQQQTIPVHPQKKGVITSEVGTKPTVTVGVNGVQPTQQNNVSSPLFESKPAPQRRKAFISGQNRPQESSPALQEIASQNIHSFEHLDNYLAQDKDQKHALHQIKQVSAAQTGAFNQFEARVITFENEDKSRQATVHAQKSSQGIAYSVSKSADTKDFEYAALQACRLVVFNNSSSNSISIPPSLPQAKQDIIRKAFDQAVKEAVEKNLYTEENKPHIKSAKEPQQTPRRPSQSNV